MENNKEYIKKLKQEFKEISQKLQKVTSGCVILLNFPNEGTIHED